MKVVMVGDCAFVGFELARELRKRSHQVTHITFNHYSRLRFLKAFPVPLQLAFDDCDLVHAHYARFPLYAAWLSGKPFVAHCVPPQTLILGDNKPISEIEIGDICVGAFTGHQEVTQTFKHHYVGDLIRIKASGLLPVVVTPEHPLLILSRRDWHGFSSVERKRNPRGHGSVFKYEYDSEPYWKIASDIIEKHSSKSGDYLLVPKIKGTHFDTFIDLNKFIKSNRRNHIQSRKTRGCPASIQINTEFAWLLGLYAAEGSTSKGNVRWSLNKKEIPYINRLSAILSSFGFNVSLQSVKDGDAINVGVSSLPLGRFLVESCGHGATHKQVPDFILLNDNLELAEAFFNGYFDGDGYIPKNRRNGVDGRRACTVSLKLALGIQLLGVRLGFVTTLGRHEPKLRVLRGKLSTSSPLFEIRAFHLGTGKKTSSKILGNYQIHPIKEIKKCHYEGPVYNLETTDHSYLVSNAVVHNCHGSDVRGGVSRFRKYCFSKAKKVLVSTPDLLTDLPDATWLPNPVSWEFHDLGVPKHGAVYFKHKLDPPLPSLPQFLGKIEVLARNVPYQDMPKILNQYEYVVDYHFPSLSKLALEALGCGCRVVKWQGEVVSNLPSKHRVENVVDTLLELYEEVLR